jgi:iron complex transport system substrate-binding protein
LDGLSQREIDAAVTERLRTGASLYEMDARLLRELSPDLIVTQNLCQVCAPAGNEITQLLKSLPTRPQVLWMTPKLLNDIFDNVRDLGEATGRRREADQLIAEERARIERVTSLTQKLSSRPRVFCMEWLDPIYCAGHWMPEIVELAGGVDALARKGTPSVRIAWDEVLNWAPEILIVTPCGFHLGRVIELSEHLTDLPKWSEVPAVRQGRVYAVDADSYFARPGPRVVDGLELFAHLIHPELFGWDGPVEAYWPLGTCNLT